VFLLIQRKISNEKHYLFSETFGTFSTYSYDGNDLFFFRYLSPHLYDFLEALITQQTSPEEAYRKFDTIAAKHTEQLRKYTKQVTLNKQTITQTDKQTNTQTNKQTNKKTNKQTITQTNKKQCFCCFTFS
jgi:hypothetical protein